MKLIVIIIIIVVVIFGFLYGNGLYKKGSDSKTDVKTSMSTMPDKIMHFNLLRENESFEDFTRSNIGKKVFLIGYVSQKDDTGESNKDISDDVVVISVMDVSVSPVTRQFILDINPVNGFVAGNYAVEGILQENDVLSDIKLRLIGKRLDNVMEYTLKSQHEDQDIEEFGKIISALNSDGYIPIDYYIYQSTQRARDDNSKEYLLINSNSFRFSTSIVKNPTSDLKVVVNGVGDVSLQKTTIALPE